MLANYDTKNYTALQELIASGTQIRIFSEEILDAFAQATDAIHAENAANHPIYARILADYNEFMQNVRAWTEVTYHAYNQFIFR